jgi:hypothetical protein
MNAPAVIHKAELCAKEPDYALYTEPLPVSRDACLRLIEDDIDDVRRTWTLKYWHIGRVVDELFQRGEPDVYAMLVRKLPVQKRMLQYARTLYKSFPRFNTVLALADRIEWTQVKQVLRLKEPDSREALCERIVSGDIPSDAVQAAVGHVLSSGKKPRVVSEGVPGKPSAAAVQYGIDPPAVFQRAALQMREATDMLNVALKAFNEAASDIGEAVSLMIDTERVPDKTYTRWRKHSDDFLKEAADAANAAERFSGAVREGAKHVMSECV